MRNLLSLSGPLIVRDLVVGVSGVLCAVVAFIAGCAFASAGNLAWFAFLGVNGAASLATALPHLRRVRALLASADVADDKREMPLPLAA